MAGIRPPAVASHQTVRLAPGRHAAPGAEVCVMELASMLAQERFSDRPQSVCPVVGAILRSYNDWIDDDRRKDLYRYAAEAVGTRRDFALQRTRADAAIGFVAALRRPRGRLGLVLLGERCAPEPDAGPEEIARHVIRGLRRATRCRRAAKLQAAHQNVLALVDSLIELGTAPAGEFASAPAGEFALGSARFSGELAEYRGEPVEPAARADRLLGAGLR